MSKFNIGDNVKDLSGIIGTVIDNPPSGLVMVDFKGTWRYLNPIHLKKCLPSSGWTIEYSNDVGNDRDNEIFVEWWEITNGQRSFKCDEKSDAEWLLSILLQNEERGI